MTIVGSEPSQSGGVGGASLPMAVPRHGLYGLLSGAAARSGVVLVSAPAGSGKTVLLRSWLASIGPDMPAAWVTVERGESSPQNFWRGVWLALQGWAGPQSLTLSPAPDFDGYQFVGRLLAALESRGGQAVVVIDDLNELRSAEAMDQLEAFVARRPPGMTVVLSTRRDPRIGLHRLRLTGGLTEIRAADLRFEEDETRELLERSGIHLPEESVRVLVERTEGWAAGLRLAALSLARQGDPEQFVADFSGNDRMVADYLVSEVLDHQSERVRRLLLRTSILDRVCGELADALTGEAGSEALLLALEGENAFVVSSDARRTWFRYHQLFADLLKLELKKREPELIPELHLTAAAWFSERGHPLDAVRHAQAAQDWSLAAQLLSNSWFSLHLDGHSDVSYEYLAVFPEEVVAANAELLALTAALQLNRGWLELADQYLALAVAGIDNVPEERRERLRVIIAVLRLSLDRRRGDVLAAVEEAQEGLKTGGLAAARLGLGEELRALVLLDLGFAELAAFRIEDAEEHLEQGLEVARRIRRPFLELTALSRLAAAASFHSVALSVARARAAIEIADAHGWSGLPVVSLAYWAQAMCLVWQGHLDEAEPLLDLAEQRQMPEVEPAKALAILHTRAMIDLLRQRDYAAVQKLQAAERLAERLGQGQVLATMVRRWLLPTLGRLGKLDEVDRAFASTPEEELDDLQMRLARAWVAIIRKAPAEATEVLAPVLEHSEGAASAGVDGLHAFLLQAIACEMKGKSEDAHRALEQALDLAEPDGMRWAFLLHPLRDELERHRRTGSAHDAFIMDLLDLTDGPGGTPAPAPGAFEEALSESELRVLRFLPSNLSAPEIAAELYVSTSTVKTHMRHIYAKLGVHTRTEAVARARERGLLPPVVNLRR